MFNPFKKKKIYNQIEEYTAWKMKLYPLRASMDREYLFKFVREKKVEDVATITIENIGSFCKSFNSNFFTQEAKKTIKQFLHYHTIRGYGCDEVYRILIGNKKGA